MCAEDLEPLFKQYQYKARERKLVFLLTLPEFEEVIRQKCTYCGTLREPRGLDRENNNLGYLACNVLAACKGCNFLKKELSKFEFLERVKTIQRYQDQCSPVFEAMNKRIEELEAELLAARDKAA
jgi:hypothetical protein